MCQVSPEPRTGVSQASSLKRRRTGTLSKSSSQSLDEEPSGTQSTIPVPTVSDDLGFLVIGWCSPELTTAPSASRFKSTSYLHLLASFLETWVSFSSRTLNLPTVPKLLAAGLVCQPWYHCTSFPSKLAWTSEIVFRGRWETPRPVQMSWSDVVFHAKVALTKN